MNTMDIPEVSTRTINTDSDDPFPRSSLDRIAKLRELKPQSNTLLTTRTLAAVRRISVP